MLRASIEQAGTDYQLDDVEFIGLYARSLQVMVACADAPFSDYDSFIDYAGENAPQVGNSGAGGANQISAEAFAAAADIFIDGRDDEYYPTFTGYELMAMADLTIQVYSFGVAEAVLAGTPALCIAIPRDIPTERERRVRRCHELYRTDESGGLFNYPGCVYSVKWNHAVEYLDRASLTDFPMRHYHQGSI